MRMPARAVYSDTLLELLLRYGRLGEKTAKTLEELAASRADLRETRIAICRPRWIQHRADSRDYSAMYLDS